VTYFLKFLLKDVLHQLRKEGSYSRNVLHLVEMENLFGFSLDVPKVAVANA
jgi:hypothetical protein